MNSLRFCLLTTFYPPYNFGGDGIDVQRTARALVRRGHQVTVVHEVDAFQWLARRRLPPAPVAQDGVEVLALRSRLGVLSPFLTHQLGYPLVHGRRIANVIRQRNVDVIVFNNVSLVGGPGLLSFGGSALRVYVAHEHWLVCPTHVLWRYNREPCETRTCTTCALSYGRPPQLWRHTGALERHVGDVDLFIARSEFSRQKHAEFGFKPPMRVLPYFIPGPLPERLEAPTSARPHDRPYFLFVGRLTKLKGLETIIPVFRRYEHADLLVAGVGEDAAQLEELSRDLPRVRFLGQVANEDLRQYYEHAIAAIVPSVGYETFGIVLIEALRHGTPVIARRRGSFPEIIEESGGGLLFSTAGELVAAMSRLQTDPAYRGELAANGYRACGMLWSEDVVVSRFLDLVEEAREHRARRHAAS